jgi:hypothetical protein
MKEKIKIKLMDIYENHLWIAILAIELQIALSIIASIMLIISGMFIMALIGIVLLLVTIFSGIYVMAAISDAKWTEFSRCYGND